MNNFKHFGIKVDTKGFVGDKIKIERVLNKAVIVHAYKVEKSKFNEKGCLHLQIEVNANKHVIFIGSGSLIEQIEQVPKSGFPFETVIEKNNERLIFT